MQTLLFCKLITVDIIELRFLTKQICKPIFTILKKQVMF